METCRVRAGAWPRREAEGARGSPRTPARPGKRRVGGPRSNPPPGLSPARPAARSPSAPPPRASRRPPGPLPQGSGAPRRPPAHVRPGWLRAAGLGARASRRRLAARSLALFLCSLAGYARSHSAQLTLPASHSTADAGAADARIYTVSR